MSRSKQHHESTIATTMWNRNNVGLVSLCRYEYDGRPDQIGVPPPRFVGLGEIYRKFDGPELLLCVSENCDVCTRSNYEAEGTMVMIYSDIDARMMAGTCKLAATVTLTHAHFIAFNGSDCTYSISGPTCPCPHCCPS